MSTSLQMQSISGIITQVRETAGDIPPTLVGASCTIVGDKAYVFGGRLVASRKLTNHMYILDLKTLVWTRHSAPPNSDMPPCARYFHSASMYHRTIVIFGGVGYMGPSSGGLCALNDVSLFDTDTMCWKIPDIPPSDHAARPRYAHLAAIIKDALIIVCGQDIDNNYIGDVNELNLQTLEWRYIKTHDANTGIYQSVAAATLPNTRLPAMLKDSLGEIPSVEATEANADSETPTDEMTANQRASIVRQCGHLMQNPEEPNPLYIYRNTAIGARIKRELLLVLASGISIEDCSAYMNDEAQMPPVLRFPTGHTLGHHLIVSGTHLSTHSHEFAIWTLDLGTLTWSRIDTGTRLSSGSWNRGVLYEGANCMLVFGNPLRKLLDDYNHRLVNFDHVATVDLEAFGVYRLPQPTCSSLAQEMGLTVLNEAVVTDFCIMTRENRVIRVNSAVMRQRWAHFADMMTKYDRQQRRPTSDAQQRSGCCGGGPRVGKPRGCMVFPYPYPVVLALIQYLYTDNLLTTQQHQPHVLAQLLLLADMYGMERLKQLATHALHQILSISTAPLIFETATLSHQTSLQIRALKLMIAAKRILQRQQQQQQQQQHEDTAATAATTPTDSRARHSSMFQITYNSPRRTSSNSGSAADTASNSILSSTPPESTPFTQRSLYGSPTGMLHHHHHPAPRTPAAHAHTLPPRSPVRQHSSPAHLPTIPARPAMTPASSDDPRSQSWTGSPNTARASFSSTLSIIDDRNEENNDGDQPHHNDNNSTMRRGRSTRKMSFLFESFGSRFSKSSK